MKDNRLVRIAIFLLFVAFSLVYALFLDAKAENVRNDIKTIMTHRGLVDTGTTITPSTETGSENTGTGTILTGDTTTDTGSTTTDTNTGDSQDSFLSEVLGSSSIGQNLSGTDIYFGTLDILKTLGMRYEYILKDKQYNIYYAYLGTKDSTYNVANIAKGVGAETIEIYAKNAIIDNLYFGERVTFVTLPGQLSSVTNVFIRMGDDIWLIQDTTGQYKQHKKHIRTLFTGK